MDWKPKRGYVDLDFRDLLPVLGEMQNEEKGMKV